MQINDLHAIRGPGGKILIQGNTLIISYIHKRINVYLSINVYNCLLDYSHFKFANNANFA